jgi:predicted transcriptional regulator
MVSTTEARSKAFKKALIDAGLTKTEWAEQQGVTYRHLQSVLTGDRRSDRLTAEIDRFIESQQLVPAA